MLTNFPNGITSFGMPVIGSGEYLTTGDVFFVHSTGGNGDGKSPEQAFTTIDYAIGQCTANKHSIIFVMPGHSETVIAAGGIDCDVAGISIVGLGNGTNRPTINFTTATTADIDIDAANITIDNIYFDLTGIDAVAAAIDVNAANFTIKNCHFLMADGTGQAAIAIASAATAGNMKVLGCSFLAPDAGATEAILITGTPNNIEIGWCNVNGDFGNACIANPTGNVATNLYIHDNFLKNDQTGDHSIELVSACTGSLVRNMYHNDMAQATGVDPGSCFSFECYHDDVIDTSGIIAPAVT